MAKKKKDKQPGRPSPFALTHVEPNTIRWGHDMLIAVYGRGFQQGMACAVLPEAAAEIPEFEKALVLATTVTTESTAVIRVKASPGETRVGLHLVAINPATASSLPEIAFLPSAITADSRRPLSSN